MLSVRVGSPSMEARTFRRLAPSASDLEVILLHWSQPEVVQMLQGARRVQVVERDVLLPRRTADPPAGLQEAQGETWRSPRSLGDERAAGTRRGATAVPWRGA